MLTTALPRRNPREGAGLVYLAFSFFFSIGLHPVGARWIQEHYTYDFDQETFSYYGPINLVALNMGYHNEHHDLPSIPWNNLPKLRALAPEFYDTLKYHTSWTRLLFQFIFDERGSLFSRVERMKQNKAAAVSIGRGDSERICEPLPCRGGLSIQRGLLPSPRPRITLRLWTGLMFLQRTKAFACSRAISWNSFPMSIQLRLW